MDLPAVDHQAAPSRIRDAHAHAGVLHGAGQAHIFIGVYVGLHRLQRLRKAGGFVHDLTVGQLLSRTNGIPVADLPGGDAHDVRHFIEQRLNTETGLGHAETPEGTGGRIVGIVGPAVDLKVLIVVGTRRMGTGPLQYGTAQRGIGAGIGNDLRRHALNDAVFVAADGKLHLHRMALGVDQDALRPGQLDLDGPLGKISDQGGMVLDRHVLLAAEAAAHQAVADLHQLRGKAQHPHDLVLGIVGTLVRREDHDAIPVRIRHGTLRLQEGMLCPGGGEMPGEHMLGLGNGLRGIAPLDMLVGQEVAGAVHQRRIHSHSLPGIADHGQFLIVHLHQRLGLGQRLRVLRRH